MKRASVILWLGLVFACGTVMGVLGYRLYTVSTVRANVGRPRNTPEEARKRLLDTLQLRVHTTDDPLAKISAIMDNTRERVREARKVIDPELKKIRDDQQDQIRALLSPEQASEWDSWQAERAEERKRRAERPNRTTAPDAK